MSATRDVVIIGAGPNGLVTACLLARSGLRPLVLEQRDSVGGVAVTAEIHPGFRCPTLAHAAGPFLPGLLRDLDLTKHGLEVLRPPVRTFAPSPDGRSITLYEDTARTARELARISEKDARKFAELHDSLDRIGRLLRPALTMTPPSLDGSSLPEMWSLLKLGVNFRRLGRKDAYRLLRWAPMAIADFSAEWFETNLLRAMIAARGIYGTFAGPWSAGTCVGILMQAALDGHATGPAAFFRGGMGALTQALAAAARASGAEVRTGARVERIAVAGGRAGGVLLASGEEMTARAVVSGADPKTTFLRLVDPIDLDPDFVQKIRNYRCLGTVAKINYALGALPAFPGGGPEAVSGRIHIGPDIDYLERAFDAAKYGQHSPRPYLDVTIPSVADPSLAPKGAHVMSVHVQYAPWKLREGDWSTRREALAEAVEETLSAYAPNLRGSILRREVLTPADLESAYGLTGGHIFHGEPAPDQLFSMRPLLGWARYRTPIPGLYLCGAGTHPGGEVTGACGLNASREILKDLGR